MNPGVYENDSFHYNNYNNLKSIICANLHFGIHQEDASSESCVLPGPAFAVSSYSTALCMCFVMTLAVVWKYYISTHLDFLVLSGAIIAALILLTERRKQRKKVRSELSGARTDVEVLKEHSGSGEEDEPTSSCGEG